MSLAALEATLQLYRAPFDPTNEIPVLQMLTEPLNRVRRRGEHLIQSLGDIGEVRLQDSAAQVGAGSLPGQDLQSVAVALSLPGLSADALSAALRNCTTPIMGRIERDTVLLDMRSLRDAEVPLVASALQQIAQG